MPAPRPLQRIAIIGAGMAGLACAGRLTAAGLSVALFDKGRGPGGRMSTRQVQTPLGEASFDHGAQYFTARAPVFRAEIESWLAQGLIAPWPAAGAEAFVGAPAMNAPIKAMAEALDVSWESRIDALVPVAQGWRLTTEVDKDFGLFDAVILGLPSEQAGPLVRPFSDPMAELSAKTPAQPCWTVMASFENRLEIEADVLGGPGVIGWAARNSAKPGRTGLESWVIQAGPDWSAAHLEQKAEAVAPILLSAFAERAGKALPDPIYLAAHRWRYARSGAAGVGQAWDHALGLGLCGDWLLGPRIECAWLSGHGLAGLVVG